MGGGTDFISDNPALAAYYSTRNNDRAQAEGDIQLQQAQQTQSANNAIDQGLRDWLSQSQPQTAAAQPAASQPQTDPSQGAIPAPAAGSSPPVLGASPPTAQGAPGSLSQIGVNPSAATMAKIAQTPGTGSYLMAMNQGVYQRKMDLMHQTFDALDRSQPDQARILAQQAGLNLPDAVYQNANVGRMLGPAKYFTQSYTGDPQQYGAFLTDALRGADQNGGIPDWSGAFTRNPPRGQLAAKISEATDAMGHKPSDMAIEAMAGGRLPYGSYGYGAPVPVQGADGSVTLVQPSKSGGPAAPVLGPDGKPVQAAARPTEANAMPTFVTPTAAQPSGMAGAPQPGSPTAAAPSGDGSFDIHGQDFLNALSPPIANQVKALAEGRMQFPSGFALKTPYWQKMISAVSQYDPSFDAVNYNARSKTRNDFTSGKSAQNITSFNTAIGHLGALQDAANALNNGSIPAFNSIGNTVSSATGDPRVNNFNLARNAVVDELTRAFRGTGGSEGEVQSWKSTLNAAQSPDQLNGAIKQGVELLLSRINAVGDSYNRGMGTSTDGRSLLSTKAQETLSKLQGGPATPATSAASPAAAPSAPGAAPATPDALPPAARAQLQEGHVTTFANGQRWTISNGAPQRVQ